MTILSLVLSLGALGAAAWVHLRSLDRFEAVDTAPAPEYDDTAVRAALDSHRAHIDALTDAIADLEETSRDQTLAIAEGIERVDRAERRVRSAVARARKRMEDLGYVDEGLEAEAEGLRPVDEDSGREQRMLALHEGMESPGEDDTRHILRHIPGDWS